MGWNELDIKVALITALEDASLLMCRFLKMSPEPIQQQAREAGLVCFNGASAPSLASKAAFSGSPSFDIFFVQT